MLKLEFKYHVEPEEPVVLLTEPSDEVLKVLVVKWTFWVVQLIFPAISLSLKAIYCPVGAELLPAKTQFL